MRVQVRAGASGQDARFGFLAQGVDRAVVPKRKVDADLVVAGVETDHRLAGVRQAETEEIDGVARRLDPADEGGLAEVLQEELERMVGGARAAVSVVDQAEGRRHQAPPEDLVDHARAERVQVVAEHVVGVDVFRHLPLVVRLGVRGEGMRVPAGISQPPVHFRDDHPVVAAPRLARQHAGEHELVQRREGVLPVLRMAAPVHVEVERQPVEAEPPRQAPERCGDVVELEVVDRRPHEPERREALPVRAQGLEQAEVLAERPDAPLRAVRRVADLHPLGDVAHAVEDVPHELQPPLWPAYGPPISHTGGSFGSGLTTASVAQLDEVSRLSVTVSVTV